ncbi:unnamed protein product [Lampetra fluviatilis]
MGARNTRLASSWSRCNGSSVASRRQRRPLTSAAGVAVPLLAVSHCTSRAHACDHFLPYPERAGANRADGDSARRSAPHHAAESRERCAEHEERTSKRASERCLPPPSDAKRLLHPASHPNVATSVFIVRSATTTARLRECGGVTWPTGDGTRTAEEGPARSHVDSGTWWRRAPPLLRPELAVRMSAALAQVAG